jgi:hypothetical protein
MLELMGALGDADLSPTVFCSAVRAWLAGAPTLDEALAVAVELLDDVDCLDSGVPFADRLELLATDATDARVALGASALLSLWHVVSDEPAVRS